VNPYQAPAQGPSPAPSRTLFVLAAAGAFLASAYWAALTLLIGAAAAAGGVSMTQVVLPIVLIALYAVRGFQILKGDVGAARRILWLHGIGALAALVQMANGGALLIALQAIKILIHIFGGTTAFMAQKQARGL
jgi:hypothetical protein